MLNLDWAQIEHDAQSGSNWTELLMLVNTSGEFAGTNYSTANINI